MTGEPFDKELELRKIDVLNETFHMYFNIGSSILTGGSAAFIVLLITLYFDKTLGLLTVALEVVTLGAIIGIVFRWGHQRNLRFMRHYDEWIEKIRKGESLPSIREMEKELSGRKST